MRIIITILACLGIAIVVVGTIFAWFSASSYLSASESAWSQPHSFEFSGLGYLYGFVIGLIGSVFCLIGGLIAKPRFLWLALITFGILYCIPFILAMIYLPYKRMQYPNVYPDASYTSELRAIVYLIPGFVLIIVGLIISRTKAKVTAIT